MPVCLGVDSRFLESDVPSYLSLHSHHSRSVSSALFSNYYTKVNWLFDTSVNNFSIYNGLNVKITYSKSMTGFFDTICQ